MPSGADIASYIGLSGLISLTSSCRALYDFVVTARNLDYDAQVLLTQVSWERYFYEQWVQKSGFDQVVVDTSGNILQEGSIESILPTLRDPHLLSLAWSQIAVLVATLARIDVLVQKYSVDQRGLHLPKLFEHIETNLTLAKAGSDETAFKHAKLLVAAAHQYLKGRGKQPKTASSTGDSLPWAFSDKNELDKLLKTVQDGNKALAALIPKVEVEQIVRDMLPVILDRFRDLKSTLTLLMHHSHLSDNPPTESQTMRVPVQFESHARVQALLRPPDDEEHTALSQIDLNNTNGVVLNGTLAKSERRWSAKLKKSGTWHSVLVEVKRKPGVDTEEFVGGNTQLARLLKTAVPMDTYSQPLRFPLLPFEGYVEPLLTDQGQNGRAALFFFRLPEQLQPLETLESHLGRSTPPLGKRFQIAQSLVRSFYSFVATEWYHKALRSDNILLSNRWLEESSATSAFSEIFILGFDFARPVRRKRFSNAEQQTSEKEIISGPRRKYRHPAYDGNPQNTEYRIEFDMYSVGVVLTEIAYWRPVSHRSYDQISLVTDSRIEPSRVSQLAVQVGATYANVVRRLLAGELGGNLRSGSIAWVQAFSEKVVRELDRCQA